MAIARLGRKEVAGAVATALGVMVASPPALAQDPAPTLPPTIQPAEPPSPASPAASPASPPTKATLAPTARRPFDPGRIPAYVVGGLGVVSLGVGTVFGGLSVSEHQQFLQHPTAAGANTGDSHELIADMCFGVAATLAVSAVVMFLTHEPPAPESTPVAPRISWSAVAGPHAAEAGAAIAF